MTTYIPDLALSAEQLRENFKLYAIYRKLFTPDNYSDYEVVGVGISTDLVEAHKLCREVTTNLSLPRHARMDDNGCHWVASVKASL